MPIENTLERIADALELIAAAKTGNEAPRTEAKAADAKADAAKAEAAKKAKAAADKAAADKAAKDKAAAAAAEVDPLGDAAETTKTRDYTHEDVLVALKKLIAQDGKTAAFEVLSEKGGGAKSAKDLKKEFYEDVVVECEQRLG